MRLRRLIKIIALTAIVWIAIDLTSFLVWKSYLSGLQARRDERSEGYLKSFNTARGSYRFHPIFKPATRHRNAAVVLNDKVLWQLGFSQSFEPTKSRDFFRLSSRLTARLAHAREHWPVKIVPHEVATVDLEWLNALHEFDHWDIDEIGPRHSHFYTSKGSITTLPEPVLIRIRDVARVGLTSCRSAEEVSTMVGSLRHLARLLFSSETVEGAYAGVRILRDERNFMRYYKQNNPSMVPEDYEFIPARVFEDYLNAVNFNLSAFHLLTSSQTFLQAYGLSKDESVATLATARFGTAICPAINKNLLTMKYLEPLLESEYDGRYAHIRQVLENTRGQCHVELARNYWSQPSNEIYTDQPLVHFFPLSQWLIGSFVATNMWADFHLVYSESELLIDQDETADTF